MILTIHDAITIIYYDMYGYHVRYDYNNICMIRIIYDMINVYMIYLICFAYSRVADMYWTGSDYWDSVLFACRSVLLISMMLRV